MVGQQAGTGVHAMHGTVESRVWRFVRACCPDKGLNKPESKMDPPKMGKVGNRSPTTRPLPRRFMPASSRHSQRAPFHVNTLQRWRILPPFTPFFRNPLRSSSCRHTRRMEQAEQVKQRFLDFMKQCSFSAPGESSSSVIMSSDGNLHHDVHQALSSSNPCESSTESGPVLQAYDYIGLAEVSSASSSVNENDSASDVEDTALRLGLGPLKGDHSAQRRAPPLEMELLHRKEKPTNAAEGLHPASVSGLTSAGAVLPSKNGSKRAFGEALGEARPGVNMASSVFKQSQGSGHSEHKQNAFLPSWSASGVYANTDAKMSLDESEGYDSSMVDPPPAKGQVVGWPPIRSYRKNTLVVTHSQPAVDGEGHSAVYVKVNMDGIPIGRKVDLNIYRSYESLLTALEEMFYSPSNGNCAHFLTKGVFVLTYEDKEGDWMLVGDVPWGMFVNTVRRLRIVRGSEATGLAPGK